MSRHLELATQAGVKVYFCDPHSLWQRGSRRKTNGLIKQYLPKDTDLSVFSEDELDGIADSLSTRPRATHNWCTRWTCSRERSPALTNPQPQLIEPSIELRT